MVSEQYMVGGASKVLVSSVPSSGKSLCEHSLNKGEGVVGNPVACPPFGMAP